MFLKKQNGFKKIVVSKSVRIVREKKKMLESSTFRNLKHFVKPHVTTFRFDIYENAVDRYYIDAVKFAVNEIRFKKKKAMKSLFKIPLEEIKKKNMLQSSALHGVL